MSLIGMHHREVCAHRLLRPQLQAARACAVDSDGSGRLRAQGKSKLCLGSACLQ